MDFDTFLKRVAASQLQTCFYHFTDKRNLDSIRKHGLLSTSELKRLNIFNGVHPGGDEASLHSDEMNGTDQYVCLCYTASHPMCYRAQQRGLDPVYLGINPQIIKANGVMLTNAPSNQNGIAKLPAGNALGDLDFDVLYNRTEWGIPEVYARRQAAEKYEILVPKRVTTDYILSGL
jgi:hypothetical protein